MTLAEQPMRALEPDEETALISALRDLVERWGYETYVAAPLLEPSDSFFPDRYTPDPRGVRTVARRLARYAGLEDVAIELEVAEGASAMEETLLSLTDVSERRLHLTMWAQGPPDDVPLKLAHEVARAYEWLRAQYGRGEGYRAPALEGDELPEDDELRVSYAAHYLGFGLLAAMGAHQYRASGGLQGTQAITRWVHRTTGALPPRESCFLLAVQAVVRGVDEPTLRTWKRHLGANQTKHFTRFVAALRPRAESLRGQIGLPSVESWPEARAVDPAPLEDDGWRPAERQEVFDELPVFRRRQHNGWRAVAVAACGGVAAFFAALVGEMPTAVLGALVGGPLAAAAGYFVGKRIAKPDICSFCEAPASKGLERCAGCGNRFRGTIGESEHALDAIEKLDEFTAFGAQALEEQEDADPRYVERGCKCPHCGWIPDGEAHWECSECDAEMFNTFEHGGQCPACEHLFAETFCPHCDHVTPYEWWWPEHRDLDR